MARKYSTFVVASKTLFRWDSDESYRSGKSALGWIHHDAGTLLRLKGEAHSVAGQICPDTPVSWFPRRSADDPFVSCLGLTESAARLMRRI